jgi:hypothetical protein
MNCEPAGPSLVTVFSADAIRLEELGWQSQIPDSDQRITTIEALQTRHVASPLSFARDAAGLVALQGLIWRLKAAVLVGENLPPAIDAYVARVGLGGESLGM